MKKSGIILFTSACLLVGTLAFTMVGSAKVKSISFSKKEINIGIKESKKLKTTIKKGKKDIVDLTWRSNRPKLVTVSKKGVMKGKKVGYAYIFVKDKKSKKQAKVRIHIVKEVQSVKIVNSINGKSYTTNSIFRIQTAILPKKATIKTLKWASSSKTTAVVSENGVVTTKNKGTTTITAKSTDGTNKKVSCKIKVTQPITGLSLSYDGATTTMLRRYRSKTLKATISPANASNKNLYWYSTNKEVATVSQDGTVYGVSDGLVTIKARTKDKTKILAEMSVQVTSLTPTDTMEFIAHRGYSAEYPENTLVAFEKACTYRFSAVECDIWETTDGEFAITHNKSLKSIYGVDKNITDMTMPEAKQYNAISGNGVSGYPNQTVPTLTEYLQILYNYRDFHIRPIIEFKQEFSGDSLDRIMEIVKAYGFEDTVEFCTFGKDQRLNNFIYLRKYYPNVRLSVITQDVSQALYQTSLSTYDWCVKYQANLSVEYDGITKSQVSKFKKAGLKVGTWPINDFYQAYEQFMTWGVDSITSDNLLFER